MTDNAAALRPRAATMTAGHVSRRKSTALPMLATWCPPPLEHRDSPRLLSTRRLESRAVEPTQRTTAKPMRRGHWRQSAMPGVCQQSHVRSLGHSALATSAHRVPNALEQRKRLAAAVPRRKPRSAMLTVARTTLQQDAQRESAIDSHEPTVHDHTWSTRLPTRYREVWCRFHSACVP